MDIDEKQFAVTTSVAEVQKLSQQAMLCVSGDMLERIFEMKDVGAMIRPMHVFSRTSPN